MWSDKEVYLKQTTAKANVYKAILLVDYYGTLNSLAIVAILVFRSIVLHMILLPWLC